MAQRPLTLCLVICALVTALISPACMFVSGQGATNMIEICSALGDQVTWVAVSEDGAPTKQNKRSKAQTECSFCFAQGHIKPALAQTLTMPLHAHAQYVRISAGMIAPPRIASAVYQSRAPPYVLA